MDQALPVNLAQRCRKTDGDAQEANQIEGAPLVLLNELIQRLAAWVSEYEDCAPLMTGQRERLSGPCRIEFGRERPFVLEPPKALARRLLSGNHERQHGRLMAGFSAAEKGEVCLFAQRL